MQIHEITEGLLGNLARGVATGLTGFNVPQSQANINRQAAQSAQKLQAQGYGTSTQPSAGQIERITVTFTQPGQTVPSRYVKTGNSWFNEIGTAILDPKQKAYLDTLIPTHGKREIVPVASPEPTPRRVSRRRKIR
jgi:hypothetical protein